jgi:hypothetical protein
LRKLRASSPLTLTTPRSVKNAAFMRLFSSSLRKGDHPISPAKLRR